MLHEALIVYYYSIVEVSGYLVILFPLAEISW